MAFLALLGFLAMILLSSLVGEFLTDRWMPILFALILSIIISIAGLRSGLRRYFLLAFTNLLVGFIVSWGYLGDGYSVDLYLAVIGVLLIAYGIDHFLNYLKNTPPPAETDHGQ